MEKRKQMRNANLLSCPTVLHWYAIFDMGLKGQSIHSFTKKYRFNSGRQWWVHSALTSLFLFLSNPHSASPPFHYHLMLFFLFSLHVLLLFPILLCVPFLLLLFLVFSSLLILRLMYYKLKLTEALQCIIAIIYSITNESNTHIYIQTRISVQRDGQIERIMENCE